MKKKDPLTKLQRRFVDEYLKNPKLNATECVRKAGYKTKYPEKIANQLLDNTRVLKEIAKVREKRSKRTKITQDLVLKELAIVAFSDFADYGEIKEDRSLKLTPFKKIKEGKTRAIKSIKETDGVNSHSMSLKLHDKIKPLELIGKHLGMFVDRVIFPEGIDVNFKAAQLIELVKEGLKKLKK